MRLFLGLTPFLLAVLACLPLAAQDNDTASPFPGISSSRHARFSISGTLSDATNDRAMDGIKVDLRATGGETIATVSTNSAGGFTFNNLREGDYSLIVDETGYEPLDEQVSVNGGSAFDLRLSLRKLNAADQSPGPAVSVRDLSIPQKAQDFMKKGLSLLYDKADYRGSIEQFQSAIREYPNYYEAYAEVGMAYTRLGDAPNAEQALRKSIDLSNQRYTDAYLMLSTLYSDGKRFADAEPMARKGSELEGNSWQGHYELARALHGLGRDAEAEPQALAAEQLQPDRPEIRLMLVDIHIRLHNYPLVLEDVNAYLRLEPNGPASDQVRRLREQVQQALQKAQAPAAPEPSSGAESQPPDDRQEPDSK